MGKPARDRRWQCGRFPAGRLGGVLVRPVGSTLRDDLSRELPDGTAVVLAGVSGVVVFVYGLLVAARHQEDTAEL